MAVNEVRQMHDQEQSGFVQVNNLNGSQQAYSSQNIAELQ